MTISILNLVISLLSGMVVPVVLHFLPNKREASHKTEVNKRKIQNVQSYNTYILQENSNYQNNSNYQIGSNIQSNSNNTTVIISSDEKTKSNSDATVSFGCMLILIGALGYVFVKYHFIILFIMMILFSLYIGFPKDRYKIILKSKSDIWFVLTFIVSVIFFVFPFGTTSKYIEFLNNANILDIGNLRYTVYAAMQCLSSILWILMLLIDAVCKMTTKLPNVLYNCSITKSKNKKVLLFWASLAAITMSNLLIIIINSNRPIS